MPRTFYDYVDEFDILTARFDTFNEFYNGYRRKHLVEPGARDKGSADGAVEPHFSSYYSSSVPVLHFATGEVILTRDLSRDPQHRGRYTFAGHDFSVISTSNDPYGTEAIKFMSYMNENDNPRPKITPASFNTLVGGSTKGQDLLIDHITNRVWAIGAPWDVPKVTEDGVSTNELSVGIPDKINLYQIDGYTKGLNMGFKVQRSIRLTMPRTGSLLPPGYKDQLAACKAWFALKGLPMDHYVNEYVEKNSTRSYSRSALKTNLVAIEEVARLGFVGMSNYQRACVAQNNATQSPPRVLQHYYMLRFDSEGFFKSFA